MELIKYPDNSSYFKLDDSKPDSYYKEFIFRINDYRNVFELAHLVDAINYNRKFQPTVIIPNLLDAQADKRFADNESSGLKIMCDFLNTLKVEKYKIFHPHNAEVVEAYIPNVEIISNADFIMEILINHFEYGMVEDPSTGFVPKYKNLVLLSVDAGGFKPLVKLCSDIEWKGERLSASKSHSYDENEKDKYIQELARMDFQGKDILVIDDISVFGGTFKGISGLLDGRNFGNKYLAVSHMTVQNLGKNPVTNFYDTVFTTNSKYPSYIKQDESSCEDGIEIIDSPYIENLEIIKLF